MKEFLMGCDPEFICYRGKDIIQSNYYGDHLSDFGSDGGGRLFEVRPEPSQNPLELVNNIHGIFGRKVISQPLFHQFTWRGGSYFRYYPLGGHIHFSVPSSPGLLYVLNQLLATTCLLLENKIEARTRRTMTAYGAFSNIRKTDYGFEYRTLSSWLTSPYVSAAVLCLAKTIVFEYLNNNDFKKIGTDFMSNEEFIYAETDGIYSDFSEIWCLIKGMKKYQEYKPYLDFIYFLVKNNLTWYPCDKNKKIKDIKESWGICNMSPFFRNKIPLEMIWAA